MDIPLNRGAIMAIAFLIFFNVFPNYALSPKSPNTEGLITYEGTTLLPNAPLLAINGALGVFYAEDEVNYEQTFLLNKIIECESNWRNVCNLKYGCGAGQGIAQLIPSTVEYCEEKLGKEINPFNDNENIECAIWLLTNEGWQHWGTEFTNWGSYNCFKQYIP